MIATKAKQAKAAKNKSDIVLFAHHPVHHLLASDPTGDCAEKPDDERAFGAYEGSPGCAGRPSAPNCSKRTAAELCQFLARVGTVVDIDTGEENVRDRAGGTKPIRSAALQR